MISGIPKKVIFFSFLFINFIQPSKSAELPKINKNFKSSWAQYTILLPENICRNKLQEYLKSKSIPTAVYYPIPLNEHKPYNKYPVSKGGLDVTYYLSKNVLSLPMHPYLKEDEIIYISKNINNFIKK